jgi:hypothetical protein
VIGLGLRQVQDALNRKADSIQREFIQLSDRIEDIGRKILELRGEERQAMRAEQLELREQQQRLADEINEWRARARGIIQQSSKDSLRQQLEALKSLNDPILQPAIKQALYMFDASPEELAALTERPEPTEQSPAGRLIERARTEYDLRSSDPAVRQREAITFANRPKMAQDDDILGEIEAAMQDSDPIVRELVILTTIQLHRFRALRFADLDAAHRSVQFLAKLNTPNVIPVLTEILEHVRSGYTEKEGKVVEVENHRSRMVALLRLVEWHTPEAKAAIQGRRFDRDESIVQAAERALELFPGPWSGPLKGSGKLGKRTS